MAQPGRHRARPGRDGEVHVLRAAHRDRAPDREGREAPIARRRSHDGLRADLPDRAPSRSGTCGTRRAPSPRLGSEPVRGYHSLHELNTRPAVTYLAKVKRGSDRRGRAKMTPPPPESVAAMIRPDAGAAGFAHEPRRHARVHGAAAASAGCSLIGLCLGWLRRARAATWIYQIYAGLGIAGYSHPIFWGAYIVTFVFWVGIAHAGTLISAILFLFRAKWRNAINRSAEAMTVFAVLTAAQLFLGIHVGRIWKAYFILPYPNQRGLWVNFKSPLLVGHVRDHHLRD